MALLRRGDYLHLEPGTILAGRGVKLFGAFLLSYIALAEAAKCSVPSVLGWITVEVVVGFVQYASLALFFCWHTGRSGQT
jgi:hypothetical protein